MIDVKQIGHSDPLAFDVTVSDAGGATRHHVTIAPAAHDRLTTGSCPPERFIEAVFRFLLDREPKEAILSRFDVSVVSRYFPGFESELRQYIASGSAEGDGA